MKIPPGSRHPHPHTHSLPHGLLLRGCLLVSVMLLVVPVVSPDRGRDPARGA
jgi:hypothetical protein